MKPKDIKQLILDKTSADKVIYSKGTYKVRKGYFYRHGMTSGIWANNVLAKLQHLVDVKVINKSDVWQEWPKDSHFEVELEIAELQP